MSWMTSILNKIWLLLVELKHEFVVTVRNLKIIIQMLLKIQDTDNAILEQAKQNGRKLDRILLLLQPPPPVKFQITFIGENKMGNVVKATVDFQLKDDGSATATLTPLDKVGNVTTMPDGASVPAWVSSDPAVVVAAAADGLSATLTPSGALATGVVVSASSTLADGSTISGQGDPIDVVADSAVGFKITEQ